MTQIFKYIENNDASSTHYQEFNKDSNNKYPTFSICFEGELFYYKRFEEQLFEDLGMNVLQYGNMFKGQDSFTNEYNPKTKLYHKIPQDFKSVSHINFTSLNFNLSDIVTGLDLITYNEEHTKKFRVIAKKKGVLKLPFKLTYQTWKEMCFTRTSTDLEGARRKYDFLSLDSEVLKLKRFEDTDVKLILHYPGQMLRSMHKPVLRARFDDLSGIDLIRQRQQLKLRELFLQRVTVLKMRSDSNQPCDDEIVDDDAKFIDEIVKETGCIPIYLNALVSKGLKYGECKSPEQYRKAYQLINNYKDTLMSYNPPCVDMRVMTRDQYSTPLRNQHKEIDIKLIYSEGSYQETINSRDFGMDAFWIGVGGFAGLFLGYSVSSIPDLIASIPAFFRKQKYSK